MLINFCYGYMDHGVPVLEIHLSARKYLRTWCAVDMLGATIPPILRGAIGGRIGHRFYMVSMLRLPRVERILRALLLETSGTSLRVMWSLIMWLTIAHIFACTWFLLGWFSRCSLYEDTWISYYWPGLPLEPCLLPNGTDPHNGSSIPEIALFEVEGVIDPELKAAQLLVPWPTMYVSCLYWALATTSSLGYGEGPKARTPLELFMSICCQVIGACISAAIFGNIAQLIQKMDALGTRYKAQQDKINEFVHFHKIKTSLRRKLHAYNKLLFSVNRGFDVGQISAALPANLRQDLLLQMHQRLVRSVPLFANCDEAFIKSLVGILRPQVLLRGDCAFRVREPGDEMYFIQSGRMQMLDESLTICYNDLYSGAYFGELAMLTRQPRTATARAVTSCVLKYITAADFRRIAAEHRQVRGTACPMEGAVSRALACGCRSCGLRGFPREEDSARGLTRRRLRPQASSSRPPCLPPYPAPSGVLRNTREGERATRACLRLECLHGRARSLAKGAQPASRLVL